MTEDDAKKKRCCGPEGCGQLRFVELTRVRFCIGSECMAWRCATASIRSGYCGLAEKEYSLD